MPVVFIWVKISVMCKYIIKLSTIKKFKTTTSGYKFQSKIRVKFRYNNFGVTSKAYTSGYKLKIVR